MSKFIRGLIGAIGLFALLTYFYQIVSTWLFHDYAVIWFSEVAVYGLMWAMLVAASELVRVDGHIRADFLVSRLSAAAQRRLEIFSCSVGVVFGLLMLWHGTFLTLDAWELNERSPTTLAFPLWVYYSAIPVSGALLAPRFAIRLWRWSFRYDPGAMRLSHPAEVS